MIPAEDFLVLEARKEDLRGGAFDNLFGKVTVKGIGELLKKIEAEEKGKFKLPADSESATGTNPYSSSWYGDYLNTLYASMLNNKQAQPIQKPVPYRDYESEGLAALKREQETLEGLRSGRYGLVSQDFEEQFIVLVNKAIEASLAKYNYYSIDTVIRILYQSLVYATDTKQEKIKYSTKDKSNT